MAVVCGRVCLALGPGCEVGRGGKGKRGWGLTSCSGAQLLSARGETTGRTGVHCSGCTALGYSTVEVGPLRLRAL